MLFPGSGVVRLALCVAALVLFGPATGAAKESRAIAFLGIRQDVGFDTPLRFGAEQRALVVSELTAANLEVIDVQAERENQRTSDLALGAAVSELACDYFQGNVNCKIGVAWHLYDSRSRPPVYTVLTRAIVYNVIRDKAGNVASTLLRAAVASLLKRAAFHEHTHPEAEVAPSFTPATFKRCSSPSAELPRQAEEATKGAVLIRTHFGGGSGFFLNSEGFVLTAAHVANMPGLAVQLATGEKFDASLIRVHKPLDVALVRVEGAKVPRCFEIATAPTTLGTEVYAIGSPLSAQLAFSLSRGIVSGIREHDGYPRLQTDTAVNPGNSGGPLLGNDGKAAGVVVSKVQEAGVEGIGFAVPIAAALQALGLKPDASSSPELEVALPPAHAPKHFKDTEDPALNTMAPAPLGLTTSGQPGERAETASPSDSTPSAPLPAGVAVVRYSGLVLGLAGLAGVIGTSVAYDRNDTTEEEYDTLVLWNDISWGATLLGGGMFGASFLFGGKPDAAATGAARRSARPRVLLSFGGRF